jgi:hypothetical protein
MNNIFNVWISSIEHLNTFQEVFKSTNWFRKYVVTNYKIPKNFPHIRCLYQKMPIIFFAQGELHINNKMSFYSKSINKILRSKYRNLKDDFELTLERDNIQKIERHKFISPFIKYYTLNWIKIINNESIILIHCAGYGPLIKKISENTNSLFEQLLDYKNTKINHLS